MENHIYDIDREAEAHGYENAQPFSNFELQTVKESVLPSFESQVQTLIDGVKNGEIKALEVFATFKKIESVFKSAKEQIDEWALHEAETYGEKSFSIASVKFTINNGSERLNYAEDHVVRDLTDRLKQRQELVKLATKSKDVIFDSDGVEVTKVSSTFTKPSISIKF